MKAVVIGSGGREHAIVWKISQSPRIKKIWCLPGNAGISSIAECVNIKADNIGEIFEFVKKTNPDIVVVGPEKPLCLGLSDRISSIGINVFGPSKDASQLEGSKVFSKLLMKKYNIPTANAEIFKDYQKALHYVESVQFPIVIKADGLAAGKGVLIAKTKQEAKQSIKMILVDRVFGFSGEKIIVEECLTGQEASILALTDGKTVISLAPSQDHKRIGENDTGPNTGGMGAYSPTPVVTDSIIKEMEEKILKKTVYAMEKEGHLYRGVLYAGIMITSEGPKVLEFNVRFGDPEAQSILPRLDSDIVDAMLSVCEGKILQTTLKWKEQSCVCVVVSSRGYPGDYEKGKIIYGLDKVSKMRNVHIFHSGTKFNNGNIITDSGRVISITAMGKNIKSAIKNVYNAVSMISFENMYYRKDIARVALLYE